MSKGIFFGGGGATEKENIIGVAAPCYILNYQKMLASAFN